MKKIVYRSVADMSNTILKNLHKFPHDIDLVVGIPRSGMLPANLLALYLNKPYTDINSFVEGKIYSMGERGKSIISQKITKILVVDDSIFGGGAMKKAKSALSDLAHSYNIQYAAVYAKSWSKHLVDFYCEIIDEDRIFEWNFFHHSYISNSCFDIDGVLCLNPPIDDDGPIYSNYIANAIPLYIPSVEIDTLVSCRLEKYRTITEEWLRNNNVKYKRLILLNLKSRSERLAWGNHGKYKGEIYKKSSANLFVESSLSQALDIAKVSQKPVFCIETFSLIEAQESHNIVAIIKKKIHNHLWLYKQFHKS